jgi:hypothetical protein
MSLKDDLRKMSVRPNFTPGRNYDMVRDRIKASSDQEKREALRDPALVTSLRQKMMFQDFAKAVELLGRQSPTGEELIKNPEVKKTLDAAWAASNVSAKNPDNWRENGGYIFLNVVSGSISTMKAAPGNWGQMALPSPDLKTIPEDSIVVAVFHTHPNPDRAGVCEEHDIEKSSIDGVPDIVRGHKGPFSCGVKRRLHLAGARGYPGSGEDDAP